MEKEELLKKAQIAYDKGEPIMEDEEFDALSKDVSQFKLNDEITYSVRHYRRMGTTGKVHNIADLLKAIPDEVYVQPKFDGISLEIILNNGQIQSISSRGDEEYGQDLMKLYEAGFLKFATWSSDLAAVYGELTLYNYNPTQKDRNTVTGIVNSNEPGSECIEQLRLNVFDAYFKTGVRVPFGQLESLYICNSPKVSKAKTYQMRKEHEMVETFKDLFDSHYPSTKRDGIIFKTFDNYGQDFIIALKPEAEAGVTQLLDVSWKRGKEKFAATAIIDPITLGGVKISRVTLPTSYIKDMDLHIGDFIKVSRRGDVIPKIEGVSSHSEQGVPIEEPNLCEYGHPLHVVGKALLCTEDDCKSYEDSFLDKTLEVMFWDVKRAPKRKWWKLYQEGELTFEDMYFVSLDEIQYPGGPFTDREYKMFKEAKHRLMEEFTDSHILMLFNISGLTYDKAQAMTEKYDNLNDIFDGNIQLGDADSYSKYLLPIASICSHSEAVKSVARTIYWSNTK